MNPLARTSDPDPPAPPLSRWLSALELSLGAAIVVGHNVFKVLPNEVPILFVAALLSFRLREGRWSALRFRRPASWLRLVAIAVAAAATRLLGSELLITPLTARIWPAAEVETGLEGIAGNLPMALAALAFVWAFAAFGEEIGYRGYLVTRAADLGRRSTAAYLGGVVVVAVLFGYGHVWKGPAGMIDSGFAGLVFGLAYVVSGRNLWASVLAHGFVDTFGLVQLFLGFDA